MRVSIFLGLASGLSVLSQEAITVTTSLVTITPAPSTTVTAVNPTFMGYSTKPTLDTYTTWFCPPGQTWSQNGNYARCCDSDQYVECGIATACLNTSLMVGPSSQQTWTCSGTGIQTLCLTATVYPSLGANQGVTNIQCWPSWNGGNWDATRDIAITTSAPTTIVSVVTITSIPLMTSTSYQTSTPTPLAFTLSPCRSLHTGTIIGIVVGVIFIATEIFPYLCKRRWQIYPSRNTPTVAADLMLQSHLSRLTLELSDKSQETQLPDEQKIQPQISQLKGQYGNGSSDTDQPMLPNLEIAKYFMISSAVFSKIDKCLPEFNPANNSIRKNMIGPRGMMRDHADRQAQNARERLASNLRDKQHGSQESTAPQACVLNTTSTVPRNITLVKAEKERRRKLDHNEIPPLTESLWRESRQDSPFEYRLLNRKIHVTNQQGDNYIDDIWVYHRVFVRFKNLARKLIRSKPLHHQERLEWKCGCGEDLFADISSSYTEEINRLSSILQCAGSQPPHTGSSFDTNILVNTQRPQQAYIFSRTGSSSSTQSSGSSSTTLIDSVSSTSTSVISSPANQAYLEVCINTGEYTKTLSEIDLKNIRCDGELFKRIRSEYSRLRNFRSRFRLVKPSGVHFVKFAVQDPLRVGILQKPLSIPPQSEVDAKKYFYSPCPLQDDPPMPQDIFLHYLSCTFFDPTLAWLPRLPKKIDSSILRFTGAINEGWGIHINEGPNWFAVGIINLCLMIMSGVAAGLWKYFMNDFQGAFGFAGWIVAVVNAVLVAYVAKWSHA